MSSSASSAAGSGVSGRSIASWCLNPVIRLRWRDWGGDSVVFEARSGDTLLFDPFSAAVMACIEDGLSDRDALAAALAGDLGTEVDGPFMDALCTVLERLSKLGWIEPTPAPRRPSAT